MGDKINYTYEDGMISDNHGNRIAGDGISCANGDFVKLNEEQQKFLDELGHSFISLDQGPANPVIGAVEIASDLTRAVTSYWTPDADKQVETVDIGDLSSPLKNLCEHANDEEQKR